MIMLARRRVKLVRRYASVYGFFRSATAGVDGTAGSHYKLGHRRDAVAAEAALNSPAVALPVDVRFHRLAL